MPKKKSSQSAKGTGTSASNKYCLVRWLEDESVGVMPLSSSKTPDVYVGKMTEFKYCGKYYDAEILKISENRSDLLKVCDQLVSNEVSREDLLSQAEEEVDSTTEESPCKKKTKQTDTTSSISAAKQRAAEIFGNYMYCDNGKNDHGNVTASTSVQLQLPTSVPHVPTSVTVPHVPTSVPHVPTSVAVPHVPTSVAVPHVPTSVAVPHVPTSVTVPHVPTSVPHVPTSVTIPHVPTSVPHVPIAALPHVPLAPVQSTQFLYDGISSSNELFDSPHGSHMSDELHWPELTDESNGSYYSPSNQFQETASLHASKYNGRYQSTPPSAHAAGYRRRPSLIHVTSPSSSSAKEHRSQHHQANNSTNPKTDGQTSQTHGQADVNKVELVEGYGITITKPQLDSLSDCTSPTRLVRNVVDTLFTKETLANSTVYGSRGRPGLDPDILNACIRFV